MLSAISLSSHYDSQTSKLLDGMMIEVQENENRPVSFTNKEAAYYYTQSHTNNHPEHAWFAGMNIAKSRIFHGYQLYRNAIPIDNKGAKVQVSPYRMIREQKGGLKEEVWMFDYKNALEITLSGNVENIGIQLLEVPFLSKNENTAFFKSMEGNYIIGISPIQKTKIRLDKNIIRTDNNSHGFYIAVGQSENEVIKILKEIRSQNKVLKEKRIERLEKLLLQNCYLKSSDKNLQLALNWLQITTDQLVTKQQGDGIYAGLPWFNEYWGRDEFISLPGAVLVNGEFKTAKNILKSFAKYQNTDPDSKFFGRVPNIVNPQNIDYHTTDGTPRFIIELQDYIKYSGDISLISELYPVVKNSIEGALKYWTDDKGYLLHEDNETWMDARDENKNSYSPRGTRANDIQDLWYRQLLAGAYFADNMKDDESSRKWKKIAEKVKKHFAEDFTDAEHSFIADRLDKNEKPEFSVRPNQLFALDLIEDSKMKTNTLKTVWTELVYPWGVATLDKANPNFHPFHLSPDYHKDAAYHNGTIWPWLNGIAMQRMIEAEQVETAYHLFKNMNEMALTKGVVGGLSENLDAFLHKGQTWPKLTGTYLQAWSNAEQLRIWYQYFLGIRPDMTVSELTLAPRIPSEIKNLEYHFFIGNQMVKAHFQNRAKKIYTYDFGNISLKLHIDIFPYEKKSIEIPKGSFMEISDEGEGLIVKISGESKNKNHEIVLKKSSERQNEYDTNSSSLENISFAAPDSLSNHPVIKTLNQ